MNRIDRITPEMIRSWNPCFEWTDERIIEAFGGREYVTVTDILRATSGGTISISDAFWVIFREGIIADQTLRIFACDCVEKALNRERAAGREPDPRSWTTVEVARSFADGKSTREELGAARDASWDASWDAARAAAGAAVWAVSRDADQAWQLNRLIELIEKHNERTKQ